ncbi:hypothetical protein CLAIMM_15137 [Cladophialophora immunda]|nr:hypothetical protein CLAIMM_15137 [Cladophialophora immunda]
MASKAYPSRDIYEQCPIGADQFRVLRLDTPWDGVVSDEPMQATLEVASFKDPPCYSTLSYAWGNQAEKATIMIAGKAFDASATVDDALRKVRLLTRSDSKSGDGRPRIWIDQICINQSDISERNCQVSRMQDIYKSGRECFVYLGKGSEGEDDVHLLKEWVRSCRAKTTPITLFFEVVRSGGHSEILPGERNPWRSCLNYIMQQLYFTRLWVLQEIHFSRKVTCLIGKDTLDWKTVAALALEIPQNKLMASNAASKALHTNPDNVPDLSPWRSASQGPSESSIRKAQALDRFSNFVSLLDDLGKPEMSSLLDLLNRSRSLNTTDPRDKIFALLNLAGDRYLYPAPDYSASVDGVYNRYASSFAEEGHGNRMLPYAGVQISPSPWPSWVPRWIDRAHEFTFECRTEFRAGGKSLKSSQSSVSGTLRVKAFHLDTLAAVSGPKPCTGSLVRDLADFVIAAESIVPERWRRATKDPRRRLVSLLLCDPLDHGPRDFKIEEFEDEAMLSINYSPTFQSLLANNSFVQSSLSHAAANGWSLKSQAKQLLPVVAENLVGAERWSRMQASVLGVSPFEEYVREKLHLYFNHRGWSFIDFLKQSPLQIFATQRGRMGFASSACRQGDRVVILKGARAPFIFRKCGNNEYQNLGEAYVQGVMKGEVFEDYEVAWGVKHVV